LHFGSLVAAAASYLDARHHQGEWLVRIENLDPPREKKGATDSILRTLEAFGFEWDGRVERQSCRFDIYGTVVDDLLRAEAAYCCICSRTEIARVAENGIEGPVYPGTCRGDRRPDGPRTAVRVLTGDNVIDFHDRILGRQSQRLGRDVGDFVVRRTDGIFAYQLAVVLDDAWQGITHVVRGADLALSTPRQLHLQALLGVPRPFYAHVPLVVDAAGRKLSKSDAAHPVERHRPLRALRQALGFLGQAVPDTADLHEFWTEAAANWNIGRVPRRLGAR
jgi:glutamyl-Q tRNA(Asp) synthetase